jgi:hypothetical protein
MQARKAAVENSPSTSSSDAYPASDSAKPAVVTASTEGNSSISGGSSGGSIRGKGKSKATAADEVQRSSLPHPVLKIQIGKKRQRVAGSSSSSSSSGLVSLGTTLGSMKTKLTPLSRVGTSTTTATLPKSKSDSKKAATKKTAGKASNASADTLTTDSQVQVRLFVDNFDYYL